MSFAPWIIKKSKKPAEIAKIEILSKSSILLKIQGKKVPPLQGGRRFAEKMGILAAYTNINLKN